MSDANVSDEASWSILEAVDFYQVRNRFSVRAHVNQHDAPIVSHLLLEIGQQPGCSLATLVDVLRVPKTTLLRHKAWLVEQGLVREDLSQEDGRKRRLFLTPDGWDALRALSSRNELVVSQATERWAESELLQLQQDLRRFANSLGAHAFSLAGVGSVRAEMVRVTRGLDLLRGRVSGASAISTFEYQVLNTIVAFESGVTHTHVSKLLSCPTNTLSFVLKKLSQCGLIRKAPMPSDLRSARLLLTAKGRRTLELIKRDMTTRIEVGLRSFSQQESQAFAHLLRSFVGLQSHMQSAAVSARRVGHLDELGHLRRLVVRNLLETKTEIPHEILPPSSCVVGIFLRDVALKLFEFTIRPKGVLLRGTFTLSDQAEGVTTSDVLREVLSQLPIEITNSRQIDGGENPGSETARLRDAIAAQS
jgi:DNA-binding MarR family transcriptional regulator